MKIAIVTPFYPPDIGFVASYVKDLAYRLSKKHEIEILTYGRIPEKIDGVKISCVNGFLPIPIRVAILTYRLLVSGFKADFIYAQNGASVELPSAIAAFILRKPLIVGVSDKEADKLNTEKRWIYKKINDLYKANSSVIIFDFPSERPEILPFKTDINVELDKYEREWMEHLDKLEKTLYAIKK